MKPPFFSSVFSAKRKQLQGLQPPAAQPSPKSSHRASREQPLQRSALCMAMSSTEAPCAWLCLPPAAHLKWLLWLGMPHLLVTSHGLLHRDVINSTPCVPLCNPVQGPGPHFNSLGPSVPTPATLQQCWSPALSLALPQAQTSDLSCRPPISWMGCWRLVSSLSLAPSPFAPDWTVRISLAMAGGYWWTLLPAHSSAHCVHSCGAAPHWWGHSQSQRHPLTPISSSPWKQPALTV